MKYSTLASYQKALEGLEASQMAPVTLVLAKDDYERKQAIEAALALCKGWDVKRFEGDCVQRGPLFDELNAMPFLGLGSCILLHDVDKLDKGTADALADYVERPNRAVRFFMDASALPPKSKLVKLCEEHAVLCSIPELRPWEKEQQIEGWIRSFVKAEGRAIDGPAASMLARQLGTDKQLLEGEIEKLLCYVGERKAITVDDVTAICACVNLDTVWQLGEVLLRRDGGKALSITRKLFADGMTFLTLLWQVRGQFQTSFQICSIMDGGGSAGQV
ncbi:MAG: DNA polymerase III subunit delta, partial [Chlamydiia bacterium]|nr:DNA polymerase III subunit delta [Chlamydiia bacterium]